MDGVVGSGRRAAQPSLWRGGALGALYHPSRVRTLPIGAPLLFFGSLTVSANGLPLHQQSGGGKGQGLGRQWRLRRWRLRRRLSPARHPRNPSPRQNSQLTPGQVGVPKRTAPVARAPWSGNNLFLRGVRIHQRIERSKVNVWFENEANRLSLGKHQASF